MSVDINAMKCILVNIGGLKPACASAMLMLRRDPSDMNAPQGL